MRHLRSAALLGVALFATGCGKKPAPEPVVPPRAEAAPAAPRSTDDGSAARAAEAARRAAEEAARRNAEILGQMVFFDYDISTIRADQRSVLDAKLPILRGDRSIRLRIEGHADDRGSTEYNMALGYRRAEAIRDYLVGFGLEASRFEVTSRGEERPLVQGATEASWARNRRGEFAVRGAQTATGNAR